MSPGTGNEEWAIAQLLKCPFPSENTSFIAAQGLLSSCGVRVFSSLVVARGLCRHGTRIPERMGFVVCGMQAL